MDKSFEGLLLSIFLHIALVLLLLYAKLPASLVSTSPTEVTFVERPHNTKSKAFVTETEPKKTEEALKDEADFLSQFTKRVKKQLRAANNGPTVNAAPRPSAQQEAKRVAGLENQPRDPGIGTPDAASNQAIRNVAIGQSSIAEYIPGVQEGSFTSLNTDQFTYYAFFSRMNEQVRYRWISNVRNYMARLTARDLEFLSKMERHTQIEIILSPDGQFSSSVLQASSGDRELDQTTIEAFRAAAPFPNPPHGMIEGDGFIHLRYGFLVYFRPPSFGPAAN